MTTYHHTPVLLKEVLSSLRLTPGQCVIDATLGGGGYTLEFLKAVGTEGLVLSIDEDEDAINHIRTVAGLAIKQGRLKLHLGNFNRLSKIVRTVKFPSPDVIVADLGLSSHELDESGKGFTFQKDEPLDMRFGSDNSTANATDILGSYSEVELSRIFKDFGEERYAKSIARNIVRKRLNAPLKRTTDLVTVIADSIPRKDKRYINDSARRIFQALRIEVNHELENLRSFLDQALNLLKPGGRVAIVTFHSLEDRIVKHYFLEATKGCICPKGFPVCICGKLPTARILTKKPISASVKELLENPRSKSAKLRVLQKH